MHRSIRLTTCAFLTAVVASACHDSSATVGDDRAGFVACGAAGDAHSCGPGLGCCELDGVCAQSPAGCSDPFQLASCDGPEDCAAGEQCWVEAHAVDCATSSPYFDVRCHSDADCVEPSRNPCVEGNCIGAVENVPPASDAGS
jgi:hypothetical protein